MPDYAEPLIVKYLHEKGEREGIPVSGTFELTQRCNFNCEMCYVHDCKQKTGFQKKPCRFFQKHVSIRLIFPETLLKFCFRCARPALG